MYYGPCSAAQLACQPQEHIDQVKTNSEPQLATNHQMYHRSEPVPQGSVPGPLPFLLYTANLAEELRDYGIYSQFYADDINIYFYFLKRQQPQMLMKLLVNGVKIAVAPVYRKCHYLYDIWTRGFKRTLIMVWPWRNQRNLST